MSFLIFVLLLVVSPAAAAPTVKPVDLIVMVDDPKELGCICPASWTGGNINDSLCTAPHTGNCANFFGMVFMRRKACANTISTRFGSYASHEIAGSR